MLWRIIEGLAYLCLSWPLIGLILMDVGHTSLNDGWWVVVAQVMGPACLGVLLMMVHLLSRYVGSSERVLRWRMVPSLSRDFSNLSLIMVVLVLLDVVLVVGLEDRSEWWLDAYGQRALSLCAVVWTMGAMFRTLARLIHGPPRSRVLLHEETVVSWGHRGLGFAVFIPSVCIAFLMVDYELRGSSAMNGTEWTGLLVLMMLGFRSATATRGDLWAQSPWEIQIRRASLITPWRMALSACIAGVGIFFAGGPYLFDYEGINVVMVGLYYILLMPTGVALCILVLVSAYRVGVPMFHRQVLYRQLSKGHLEVRTWSVKEEEGNEATTSLELHLSSDTRVLIPSPFEHITRFLESGQVARSGTQPERDPV